MRQTHSEFKPNRIVLKSFYPKKRISTCGRSPYYNHIGEPGLAQSVQRLATGWASRGSNPSGGEIFRTRPDQSWDHPASYTMGTCSFCRGQSGRGVALTTHPHPAPRLKKRIQLYLYSRSGPSWPVPRANFTLYDHIKSFFKNKTGNPLT
jgi:hypothetical protein